MVTFHFQGLHVGSILPSHQTSQRISPEHFQEPFSVDLWTVPWASVAFAITPLGFSRTFYLTHLS